MSGPEQPDPSGTGRRRSTRRGRRPGPASAALVVVMAVATGAIVANLYYAQPLLHEVAPTFHVGPAAAAG